MTPTHPVPARDRRETIPMDDDKTLADWVVSTCTLYGASVATAYQVAGLLVLGIRGHTPPAAPARREE